MTILNSGLLFYGTTLYNQCVFGLAFFVLITCRVTRVDLFLVYENNQLSAEPKITKCITIMATEF